MGYLVRLADKRYRIKYDIIPTNGKTRQIKTETLDGVTKPEAAAVLAKRKAEVTKQRMTIADGEQLKDEINLSTLFDKFIEQKRNAKEYNTISRYSTLVKLYLKPTFGHMQAKRLKPHHLTTAYAEWLEQGPNERKVSAKTVRHVHELLRNILNWGVRHELLSRNVAALVEDDDLPKVVQPKPLALTDDELRKVLAEAKNPTSRSKKRGYISSKPWFYAAIVFASYTGCRRGEILAVRWSDINFDGGEVTISRSLTERMAFKTPKNDKTRTIVISGGLCSVLRSHRAAQAEERLFFGARYKDQDLVFAHADGSPIDPWNFARAVRDLVLRAKVTPITLHGLRDTHASLLAKAGVPIEVISQRLGHSSILVTASRYLHVYRERDADAASAFDRLVG